jgi:predicted ATPase
VIMLDTIREFASEQLHEKGEESLIQDAHMRYFAQRAEQMAPLLRTSEVRAAMPWFGREVENLQAALDHATRTGASVRGSLEEALRSFRRHRGYWMSW